MMQRHQVVAIGASAGGVEVVCDILEHLSSACKAVFLLVIHVPVSPNTGLSKLLAAKSSLPVVEVDDKEQMFSGHVYLAPADYHVLVEDEVTLSLSNDEPVNYSRPSIDVLFESAADVFGDRLTGVILTGANRDGAGGLAKVISAGGFGVVQDPEEAPCRAMPDAAIRISPSACVMTRLQIIDFINQRS